MRKKMQYNSRIIGFVLIETKLFPMYIAGANIPCECCPEIIVANDTFTRNDSQRKAHCKVCRPIVGKQFIKPDDVSMADFREQITAQLFDTMKKIRVKSAIDTCSAILFAAGYESMAIRIYWPGLKHRSMIYMANEYLERKKRFAEARELRQSANTFLEKKIE